MTRWEKKAIEELEKEETGTGTGTDVQRVKGKMTVYRDAALKDYILFEKAMKVGTAASFQALGSRPVSSRPSRSASTRSMPSLFFPRTKGGWTCATFALVPSTRRRRTASTDTARESLAR